MAEITVNEYIDSLPTPEKLRASLAQNQRERAILKRLLQLAEQRGKLQPAGSRSEQEATV